MNFQLRNLAEVLRPHLGPGKVIKDEKITRLTPPGENFGSVMLKLNVTIENKNGSEETLHAVAKILPETERFRKLFQIQTTYTNEIAFYETIVPALQKFQRELGVEKVIDLFPECFATRKNLTGGEEIDDDAVMVLENLIESGYQNSDRRKGLDLETTKLILKDLAAFHAVPLALKIKKPEVFQDKIKAYCHDFEPHVMESFGELITELVRQNAELAHLASKILQWGTIKRSPPREPFATVIHTDMWTNNTMQKFQDGRPVSNKFVDFQVYTYGSPAADVFFFLWSSVAQDVLETNLESLLEHYHKHFVDILKKHQVDVAPFSYENFLKELELESEYEFGHAIQFCIFLTGETKDLDIENFDAKSFLDNNVSQRTKERVWYMVKECVRRKWLK